MRGPIDDFGAVTWQPKRHLRPQSSETEATSGPSITLKTLPKDGSTVFRVWAHDAWNFWKRLRSSCPEAAQRSSDRAGLTVGGTDGRTLTGVAFARSPTSSSSWLRKRSNSSHFSIMFGFSGELSYRCFVGAMTRLPSSMFPSRGLLHRHTSLH